MSFLPIKPSNNTAGFNKTKEQTHFVFNLIVLN